ncbi:unnamed protein product, partial [Mesorhabditis belari]|uniref:Neurotransmitter-gated ion-channel ligand-binding domain-containing protein n=1 Tax=Mesorhabditis belari TaxID=2138241 RepID=A0AAF3ECA2_9BILA
MRGFPYFVVLLLRFSQIEAFVAKKSSRAPVQVGGVKRGNAFISSEEYREEDQIDLHGMLADWIKTRARPHHLPVRYPRKVVEVHVRADLYQIVDLDQRSNLATISAYIDAWWIDEYIGWNATDFGGLNRIFIPIRWLWKPEFYMYHSVQGRTPDYAPDATAEVRWDGRVRMFVPITARSLCPVNVKMMPFDEQNCNFSVSSQ